MNNNIGNDNITADYSKLTEIIHLKKHFHNSHQIIFVTEGAAQIRINNNIYDLQKGALSIISNLESHELKVLKTPYERYNILIKPDFFLNILNTPVLSSIFTHRPSNFVHTISLTNAQFENILLIFIKIITEYKKKDAFWDTNSGALIIQLLVLLYRNNKIIFPLITSTPLISVIYRIQKHIQNHYAENLNLAELAKDYYIDMYHLSRTFKKVTGYGFKDYLILQRISKAKELILHTSDSITNISLNSGFQNVNHFIHLFKKIEGVTPYQYRKQSIISNH